MANQCVVDGGIQTAEVLVVEIEVKRFHFIVIRDEIIQEGQLMSPTEIYPGISTALTDLIGCDLAEVGQWFVVMNRTNVIALAIGKLGPTLGQE